MTLWFLGVTLAGMITMIDWTDLYSYGDTETYNEDLWLSVGPVAEFSLTFAGDSLTFVGFSLTFVMEIRWFS